MSSVCASRPRYSIETVIAQTRTQAEKSGEPLSAIIQGVHDTWEVCRLNFTIDLIEQSAGGKLGDFRQRGLI
jgi:hypothetical protein